MYVMIRFAWRAEKICWKKPVMSLSLFLCKAFIVKRQNICYFFIMIRCNLYACFSILLSDSDHTIQLLRNYFFSYLHSNLDKNTQRTHNLSISLDGSEKNIIIWLFPLAQHSPCARTDLIFTNNKILLHIVTTIGQSFYNDETQHRYLNGQRISIGRKVRAIARLLLICLRPFVLFNLYFFHYRLLRSEPNFKYLIRPRYRKSIALTIRCTILFIFGISNKSLGLKRVRSLPEEDRYWPQTLLKLF